MRRGWFWLIAGLVALLVFGFFAFPGWFFGPGGCCGWGGYGGMGMGGMMGGRWGGYAGMMGPGAAAWGPFMFLGALIPLLLLALVVAGGVWLGMTLFRRAGQTPMSAPGAVPPATAAQCPQCGQPVDPQWQVCPYCGFELRAPTPKDAAV